MEMVFFILIVASPALILKRCWLKWLERFGVLVMFSLWVLCRRLNHCFRLVVHHLHRFPLSSSSLCCFCFLLCPHLFIKSLIVDLLGRLYFRLWLNVKVLTAFRPIHPLETQMIDIRFIFLMWINLFANFVHLLLCVHPYIIISFYRLFLINSWLEFLSHVILL